MIKREELAHFFFIPILIGLLGGVSAYVFRYFVKLFTHLYNTINIFHWHGFYIFTMPLLFYFSHLLISKLLKNPSNVTIDEIAKKISLMVGKFSMLKGFVVLLLTSLSIGFGVPVGREGPIAKLGGLLSDIFIKTFKIERIDIPIYLSAGVSSALAATFNAPVAGIFFGIEIIIGKINSYIVIPLIISCITATLFARAFIGSYTAFYVPHLDFSNTSYWLVPFGALFFSALAAFIQIALKRFRILRVVMRKRWRVVVIYLGLFVGILVTIEPHIRGVGYEYVTELFANHYATAQIFNILLLKLISVVISIGSGIFGGLLSPSIFIGAFGGYWFGSLFTFLHIDPRVFALIGSASVLAGISRAPLRSAIIITELTHSYQLLLPILLSSAIAVYILSKLEPGSYFKRTLIQRGIDIDNISLLNYLNRCNVRDFLTKTTPLHPYDTIDFALQAFKRRKANYIPVVNKNNELIGIVSLRDLRKRHLLPHSEHYVKDIMSHKPFYITQDSTQEDILKALSILDVSRIPYVSREKKYIGMIDIDKLLKAMSTTKMAYKIR